MEMAKGKVAIVTGGARSIGRAIAEKLYNEGATVIIGDVMDAKLPPWIKKPGYGHGTDPGRKG